MQQEKTHALVGLIAGSFGALVGGVSGLAVILAFVAPSLQMPAGSSMTPGQLQALLVGTSTVEVIVGLFLDGGFGVGMGALGGLVGAHRYRQAHPAGSVCTRILLLLWLSRVSRHAYPTRHCAASVASCLSRPGLSPYRAVATDIPPQ